MKEKNDNLAIYIKGAIAVLIIILLWLSTYFLLKDFQPEERGTLGDMFGTINALFSGLAFAGIIFTILLQKKELGYQRDELKQTRQEFKTQNKTLKSQRFENTFFNLLALHNQIVNDIDFDKRTSTTFKEYETRTVRGRDVFQERFNQLNLHKLNSSNYNEIYVSFYEQHKTDFGHYFRNLYRIIKMVKETEFFSPAELDLNLNNPTEKEEYYMCNYQEQYKYTSILRAQLSDYELLFLFYNCISDNGIEKFKPLVEEFALLKNLPQSNIEDKILIDKYEKSAFEKKTKSLVLNRIESSATNKDRDGHHTICTALM